MAVTTGSGHGRSCYVCPNDLGEAGRSHPSKELLEGDDQDGESDLVELCPRRSRSPASGSRYTISPRLVPWVGSEGMEHLHHGPGPQ